MESPENISNTEIHNFLIRRLGDKEADEIMDYINGEIDKQVSEKVTAFKSEISLWRDDMKNVFATKEDAAKLEKKLIKRISTCRRNINLWSFVFWLTLIIAFIVILKIMK